MENSYIKKDDSIWMKCEALIPSKGIKYSKLELAWRVGITVAVIALICLSV